MPRGRKPTGPTIFGFPIGPFTVWLGTVDVNDGFGYNSDEAIGLFEDQDVQMDRLKPDARKYVNDRLCRGRFGKNGNPATVDAETAMKVRLYRGREASPVAAIGSPG
jgi:hypothetical protein